MEGRSAFLSPRTLEGCQLWLQNGGMKAGVSPCRHAGLGWLETEGSTGSKDPTDRRSPLMCLCYYARMYRTKPFSV